MDETSKPPPSPPIPRYALVFFTGMIFISCAFALPLTGSNMFVDTDPLWHLAAGDWIRAHGAIPYSDPWSFTTEGYRWLNISWAWDAGLSYVHEQLDWQGAFAINAMIIALLFCCIYVHCAQRSKNLILAFIILGLVAPLLADNLRPLQITNLMTACWMLLLGLVVRRELHAKWLVFLPFSMLLWVNAHGGFVVGGILLPAFFLQALLSKEQKLAWQFFITGIATMAAMWINPYHAGIIEAVWRPLFTQANLFITEWQPFTASVDNMLRYAYLFFFLFLPLQRQPKVMPVEYALSYFWLVMGLISTRHLSIFAIISAPVAAVALQEVLCKHADKWRHFADRFNDRVPAYMIAVACVAAMLWAPHMNAGEVRIPTLKPEEEFLTAHYPKARLLTHFDLGAILVYETRGKIPVFIDPRTETAFPPEVMKDFGDFLTAPPGWQKIWDKYNMNGTILPNNSTHLIERFRHRHGWKMVFEGPTATIFMREK